ncbi:MAG TPA: response regulator [Chloroflexota bacterium]|jgi:CheY-like chemotaxis protein
MPSLPKPAVLVADDHDGVRELARFALEAGGLTVHEACDGAEALAVTRQHPIQVAVLDLGLPEPDGAELCRRIKADPATAHVRVLIVTGALDAVSQRRVAEAAPDAFLSKPFLPAQLVASVRALLPG